MNNAQRLQAIHIGGNVRRWHVEDIQGEQLVSSHTWGMTAMYLVLCVDPQMDVVRAITFHDCPEPFSGDIPWFARKACPGAAQADREISDRWMTLVLGDEPDLNAEGMWWLKTLDAAEAYLFAKRQRAMGNRLMEDPVLECVSRLEAARRDPDNAPENAWHIVQDILDCRLTKRMTRDIDELEQTYAD